MQVVIAEVDATICFKATTSSADDRCLGFLDEESGRWRCEVPAPYQSTIANATHAHASTPRREAHTFDKYMFLCTDATAGLVLG